MISSFFRSIQAKYFSMPMASFTTSFRKSVSSSFASLTFTMFQRYSLLLWILSYNCRNKFLNVMNSFSMVPFNFCCSFLRFLTRVVACLKVTSVFYLFSSFLWVDCSLFRLFLEVSRLQGASSLLRMFLMEVNISSLPPSLILKLFQDLARESYVMFLTSSLFFWKQSKQKLRSLSRERLVDLCLWKGQKLTYSRERLERIDLSSPLWMLPIERHITGFGRKKQNDNYKKQAATNLPFGQRRLFNID